MEKEMTVKRGQTNAMMRVENYPTLAEWMEHRQEREVVALLNWASDNWARRVATTMMKRGQDVDGVLVRVPISLPPSKAEEIVAEINQLSRADKAELAGLMRQHGLGQALKEAANADQA
jgi:hypothetical protein